MKTTKIIVCCHKQDVMAQQEPYLPIHVGKAISGAELGIQEDNDGENISDKNRSYCELTGMYWAWKNLKNVDIMGLCHYRRYFDFHKQCKSYMPHTAFSTGNFENIDLTIPTNVIETLSDGHIYLAKPRKYSNTLYIDYCTSHISDDIKTLERYIFENMDKKYHAAWYHVIHCNNDLSHYNMFLMTWHDFDAYCSWLFPLLLEMERLIDITHYTFVQGRIFGYMAERLLNVWVVANKMSVSYLPVIWFSDFEASQKTPSKLRIKLRHIKADLAVKLATNTNMNKWLRNRYYNVKSND